MAIIPNTPTATPMPALAPVLMPDEPWLEEEIVGLAAVFVLAVILGAVVEPTAFEDVAVVAEVLKVNPPCGMDAIVTSFAGEGAWNVSSVGA